MLKLKIHSGFHDLFDSDMSKSTNSVVYFDWKTVIYIYVCGQCRTQFLLPNESRRYITNMYFYDGKVSHIYIYDGKVSCINGASVAIILCLHVLIVRRKSLKQWCNGDCKKAKQNFRKAKRLYKHYGSHLFKQKLKASELFYKKHDGCKHY
jgi:hypothetical protein